MAVGLCHASLRGCLVPAVHEALARIDNEAGDHAERCERADLASHHAPPPTRATLIVTKNSQLARLLAMLALLGILGCVPLLGPQPVLQRVRRINGLASAMLTPLLIRGYD